MLLEAGDKPSGFRESLSEAARGFWECYHDALRALHVGQGKALTEPIKDRNLGTTNAKHVRVFEEFWRCQLATAIGVSRQDVGSRTIAFRDHRTKSFDVCYPLAGEPKILISVKSMQNAYRNITNRIEEAIGDLAILRLYKKEAVFGFFFFVLDGPVPRGQSKQGQLPRSGDQKKSGIAPFLSHLQDGGDFFDLGNIQAYTKPPTGRGPDGAKQDVIERTALSLIDLLVDVPSAEAAMHYDAIAYLPTRVKRADSGWEVAFSQVDQRLNVDEFLPRLIKVAKLRRLL